MSQPNLLLLQIEPQACN